MSLARNTRLCSVTVYTQRILMPGANNQELIQSQMHTLYIDTNEEVNITTYITSYTIITSIHYIPFPLKRIKHEISLEVQHKICMHKNNDFLNIKCSMFKVISVHQSILPMRFISRNWMMCTIRSTWCRFVFDRRFIIRLFRRWFSTRSSHG